MLGAEQTNDYLFTSTTETDTQLLLHALSDKILRFRYLTPSSPAAPSVDGAHPTFPRVPTFVEFKEKSDHYRLTCPPASQCP